MMILSKFKNAFSNVPQEHISLQQIQQIIVSEQLKTQTAKIRELFEKSGMRKTEDIKKLKCQLPVITFSGQYSKKANDGLTEYSQMIVMDIDNIESEMELAEIRTKIRDLKHVVMAFTSPSGNGLKVVHRLLLNKEIDVNEFHKRAFTVLSEFYRNKLKVPVDYAGHDLSRGCFLCHDPEVYINTEAVAFEFDTTPIPTMGTRIKNHSLSLDGNYARRDSVQFMIVNHIYRYLMDNRLSITVSQPQWIRVGFALKSEFGDVLGKELFDQFSKLDSNYDVKEVDRQFEKGIEDYPNGVGLGTIIHYAQNLNYKYPKLSKEHRNQLEEKKARFYLDNNKIQIRMNTFNGCREIKIVDQTWRRIEEKDLCYIYITVLSKIYRKNDCDDWLLTLAIENQFDPVIDYLDKLEPLEGEEHIEQLTKTIVSKHPYITRMLIRRWLIGMVASLLEPTQCNENVLIFIGEQGLGKTQWSKRLLPPEWQEYFATKNLTPGNKDDELMLSEYVLILMDELSTVLTRKASNEAFKEMMSMDKLSHRKPYAREVTNHIRKASVIGTSNEDEFLKDQTGNRRFFPIYATEINYHHKVDTSKVLSEVYTLYKNGERGHLTPEERKKLDDHNSQFEATNPYVDYIMKHCRIPEKEGELLTITELIERINESTRNSQDQNEKELIPPRYAAQVGRILKGMGFQQESKSVMGKTKRLYNINFSNTGFADDYVEPKKTSPIIEGGTISGKEDKPIILETIADLIKTLPDESNPDDSQSEINKTDDENPKDENNTSKDEKKKDGKDDKGGSDDDYQELIDLLD